MIVPEGSWKVDLKKELSKSIYKNKQINFYLYPSRSELHNYKDLENVTKDIKLINKNLKTYNLAKDNRWTEIYYRDDIHPTPEGNKVLALILK